MKKFQTNTLLDPIVQYIYCLCCQMGRQIQTSLSKNKEQRAHRYQFLPTRGSTCTRSKTLVSQMWTSCSASPAKSVFTCWRLSSRAQHCRRCEEDLSERGRAFTPALSLPPAFSFSSLSITVSHRLSPTPSSHSSLSPFLTLSHFVSHCLKSFPSPHSILSHSIFCNLPHTVSFTPSVTHCLNHSP